VTSTDAESTPGTHGSNTGTVRAIDRTTNRPAETDHAFRVIDHGPGCTPTTRAPASASRTPASRG